MTVTPHDAADRERLDQLVARERDARQRDRYRAVRLAMACGPGEPELAGDEIAGRLGRSPRFVDQWLARYRRGGLDALRPRKQPGRAPKLTAAQAERLLARLDAGPVPAADGGVCALRGRDICRIIEAEFGVVHTLGGIYDVLRRVGYASLVPRPRHRKNDPAAVERFVAGAPLLPGG